MKLANTADIALLHKYWCSWNWWPLFPPETNQTYKENVLEVMLNGTEKVPALITDYKEYHTDTTVRFVVKMTEERLREAEAAGLHKVFKLQNLLTCNSMVNLFYTFMIYYYYLFCILTPACHILTKNILLSISPAGVVWSCGQSEEVRLCSGHLKGVLWAQNEILRPQERLACRNAGSRKCQTLQPGPIHSREDPGHTGHW